MHTHLEERFPIEAGSISSKDRVLPTLPGMLRCSGKLSSYICVTESMHIKLWEMYPCCREEDSSPLSEVNQEPIMISLWVLSQLCFSVYNSLGVYHTKYHLWPMKRESNYM